MMKSKLYPASTFAVAATLFTALFSTQGSGAAAQDTLLQPAKIAAPQAVSPVMISQPVVQPLPTEAAEQAPAAADDAAVPAGASLAEQVAAQSQTADLSPELRCLAGAVYFEAKGESLTGQLAVGRVVVNRAKSGRFPASYCGVVYQTSQFSFVRGHSMPPIATGSLDWREAVAIARIADAGRLRGPAEGALFFHASHVSPRWRLTRVARIDNHVFYR
jgi:spore germination cell wall hydrolase CwlJ-like protein